MPLEPLRKLSGKITVRKIDRACFEPSYSDDYNEGKAIADIMLGNTRFYFRRVIPVKFLWMIRWVRTGDIWQPKSGEFEVMDVKFAEATLKEKP
jgi:hypothetical protein